MCRLIKYSKKVILSLLIIGLPICVNGMPEAGISNIVTQLRDEYNAKIDECLKEIEVKIGSVIEDRECYEKRYAELKAEYASAYADLRDDYDKFTGRLGNWLTGIGIFVGLFGIILPIVVTIVQRKSIKVGLEELEHGKDRALSVLRKDCVKSLHLCLAQSILSIDATTQSSTLDLASLLCSIVMLFDDLLESAMKTQNEGLVKDEIDSFRHFFDRWSKPYNDERRQIWLSCENLLKSGFKMRKECVRRRAFVDLLGEQSDSFKWLEEFYNNFAAWKFA